MSENDQQSQSIPKRSNSDISNNETSNVGDKKIDIIIPPPTSCSAPSSPCKDLEQKVADGPVTTTTDTATDITTTTTTTATTAVTTSAPKKQTKRSTKNSFKRPPRKVRKADKRKLKTLDILKRMREYMPRRACGRCPQCKNPVCGECKSCVYNKALNPIQLKNGKKRCLALKCDKLSALQQQQQQHSDDNGGSTGDKPTKVSPEFKQVLTMLGVLETQRTRWAKQVRESYHDEKKYKFSCAMLECIEKSMKKIVVSFVDVIAPDEKMNKDIFDILPYFMKEYQSSVRRGGSHHHHHHHQHDRQRDVDSDSEGDSESNSDDGSDEDISTRSTSKRVKSGEMHHRGGARKKTRRHHTQEENPPSPSSSSSSSSSGSEEEVEYQSSSGSEGEERDEIVEPIQDE